MTTSCKWIFLFHELLVSWVVSHYSQLLPSFILILILSPILISFIPIRFNILGDRFRNKDIGR
jgi:hypothetical protein